VWYVVPASPCLERGGPCRYSSHTTDAAVCSARHEATHERVASSRKLDALSLDRALGGYRTWMQLPLVVEALIGVGVFTAALVFGVSMALGSRHDLTQLSDQVRRFFNNES
jgi:hypothetical protein